MSRGGWYRRLLRFYPRAFRDRYGAEMELHFDQTKKDANGVGRFRFGVRVLVDFVRTAASAWVTTLVRQSACTFKGGGVVDRFSQDIRFAIRTLRKRPVFTIVVVATLAMGIGANTAIFTIVNEILLRPLPLGEPSKVVDLFAEVPGGNSFGGFSYTDYVDYRDRNDVLSGLAAFMGVRVDVGSDERARRVSAQFSSENYFDVLQVGTAMGRTFLPTEGQRGSGMNVVVVSFGYWQQGMGADSAVIGSTIHVDDVPFTVVGVAARGFEGTFVGFPIQMWLTLPSAERVLTNVDFDDRTAGILELVGRLSANTSVSRAAAAFDILARQLEDENPIANRGRRVGVVQTTGIDHSMRVGVTGFLAVLMVVAGLVLLVTCLNVSGMMLARSTGRQKEMTIRLAVGASRGRLVRQLLTEATVLFGLGGLAGAFVAAWLVDALLVFITQLSVPIGFALPMDWRVLLFTASAAFAAAAFAGIFPAREALSRDAASVLRTWESEDRRTGRLRSVFVVVQIAGAMVLLVGAGLFARSVLAGVRADLGFDADRVAVTSITLPNDRYDEARGQVFFSQLLTSTAAIPGVASVALAARRPLGVARNPVTVEVPGYQHTGDQELTVDGNFVSDTYLSTLGVGIIAGRDFAAEDIVGKRNVVVINQTTASRFWPNQTVVGQRIVVAEQVFSVVGVAADSRSLLQDATPVTQVYFPMSVRFAPRMNVVFRSAADPVSFGAQIQTAVARLDASLVVPPPVTLRETMNGALLPQRLAAVVTGGLGLFGFFLAALGVYGILAHAVGTRTKEIGVRLALGGRRTNVLGLVVGSGMRLVLVGVLLGLGLSLLVSPLLRGFLVGVQPFDPITFAVVSLVFMSVASIACYLPARRATRINPATVLRNE